MDRKIVLLAVIGGLVGGTVSNRLFDGLPVFAQATESFLKVLKVERLELVNKQGKALAVFDIQYAPALPDGSPALSLNGSVLI
jgi:hypothetical protein